MALAMAEEEVEEGAVEKRQSSGEVAVQGVEKGQP